MLILAWILVVLDAIVGASSFYGICRSGLHGALAFKIGEAAPSLVLIFTSATLMVRMTRPGSRPIRTFGWLIGALNAVIGMAAYYLLWNMSHEYTPSPALALFGFLAVMYSLNALVILTWATRRARAG